MPRRSIRTKLTVGALIPFAVAMVICSLTGFYLIDTRVAHQAQEKVRTDINSAREAYQSELAHLDDILRTIAETQVAVNAVARGDRQMIEGLLLPLQKRFHRKRSPKRYPQGRKLRKERFNPLQQDRRGNV